MNKTVFVTQVPNRRDHASGAMVPVFNVAPAAEHGEIKVLMPPGTNYFETAEMVKWLRNGLATYDYARGDSIVASGDPTVIAAAGALVAQHSKSMRLLKWDKSIKRYIPIDIHF